MANDYTASGTAATNGDVAGVVTAADKALVTTAKMRGTQPPASYPALRDCWNYMVTTTTRAMKSTKVGVSQMDPTIIERATGEINVANGAITSCNQTITRISEGL
jgi:hypothetical protein